MDKRSMYAGIILLVCAVIIAGIMMKERVNRWHAERQLELLAEQTVTEQEPEQEPESQQEEEPEEELEEGARSLQEAWDEIISWEGYTPLRNEFLIWFREDVTDPQAVLLAAEAAVDVPKWRTQSITN